MLELLLVAGHSLSVTCCVKIRFVGIHINIRSRENCIPFGRYQGTDTLLAISELFFILSLKLNLQ
jgi:hypothetical protein